MSHIHAGSQTRLRRSRMRADGELRNHLDFQGAWGRWLLAIPAVIIVALVCPTMAALLGMALRRPAVVARAVGTRQFRATAPVRGGGGGATFDPKNPGVVSMVMDNWVGKGGVRDGWYWWDPKGHGAVAAGLASQILTLKTAAIVTIGTTICLIERTLDYREEKAHEARHARRHGGH